MTLRLAIVTDIHHGQPTATKRGDCAADLMQDFADLVADSNVDRVLDLGDRIIDENHEADLRRSREVALMFANVPAPVWHLAGNHDRDFLSVAENEAILGQSMEHEAHDIKGWRILLWRADSRFHTTSKRGFDLPENDLRWLEEQIDAADRPLLICSHVPLLSQNMVGNYYFENATPAEFSYPQASIIRALLARAKVPVVCLSGHVHWNTIQTIDGIRHLTQQSLTESFTTGGEPAGAMGLLELTTDRVNWTVYGADPFAVSFRPDVGRWMRRTS